jgi:hypothetical protein
MWLKGLGWTIISVMLVVACRSLLFSCFMQFGGSFLFSFLEKVSLEVQRMDMDMGGWKA